MTDAFLSGLDHAKTGALIRRLRLEQKLTQADGPKAAHQPQDRVKMGARAGRA